MPKYAFECQVCAVRFDRTLKMGEHPTHECPSCKEEAPRVFTEFGFAFASGGADTANSGVHGHDYPTADVAVGRSAEARWQYLDGREKAKTEARKAGGTHALIRHNGPGYVEYEPMTPVGRQARSKLTKAVIAKSKKKP